MFFIMGISDGEKQLSFDQTEICACCGKYGHICVYMTYTYFMFFFIPLFKWNKRYFVKMDCCGSTCELDPELGRAIAHGDVTYLDPSQLHFRNQTNGVKHCSYCGYTTTEDFQYCPKCGHEM